MDIQALRTFVAVAEAGQFQAAADELRISQQAVSKRIVGLEKNLGVALLVRTSRGSRLSLDGQVFLPHARKVLAALEQAEQAVRPGSRPLRVDVLNRRIAPAQAVYHFYRSRPGTSLDTVTLGEVDAPGAARAVLEGTIDAPGTEWEKFYRSLSAAFGLSIDALGPNFGDEALMDALADSASLATLVGSGDRYLWPESYGLRRIPLREPSPVYPHVLLTRTDHQHPVLTELRDHLRTSVPGPVDDVWAPDWVAC